MLLSDKLKWVRANFAFFLNDALISRRATPIERYHQGTKACTAEHIFQLLDASLAPTATGLLPIMSSLAKLKTPTMCVCGFATSGKK